MLACRSSGVRPWRLTRLCPVLIAEVVAHYFPRLVELHNYRCVRLVSTMRRVTSELNLFARAQLSVCACSSASSVQQKLYNWQTLNRKVLRKLQYQVPRQDIDDVVNCQPGAVEFVLKNLQVRVRVASHQCSVLNVWVHSRPHTPPPSAIARSTV